MGWTVKMVEEYEEWFDSLEADVQNAIYEDIIVLEASGLRCPGHMQTRCKEVN